MSNLTAMTEPSDLIRDAVESQLADGESIEAEYVRKGKMNDCRILATLVTDRRVIDGVAEDGNYSESVDLDSYFLTDDRIVGVQYEREKKESWWAWLWELLGLSSGNETLTVDIDSTVESKTYEFDEDGRDIAQAIVQLAANHQQ